MNICKNCHHHKSYHRTMREMPVPCSHTNMGKFCECAQFVESEHFASRWDTTLKDGAVSGAVTIDANLFWSVIRLFCQHEHTQVAFLLKRICRGADSPFSATPNMLSNAGYKTSVLREEE